MKRIVPLILGMLLVASAAVAAPPPRGPNGAPPPPPSPAALADYLGLTDSQKAAAESIETDFRNDTKALHEQIHALHEQIGTARKAADTKLEALLTTEQRAKFEAFLAAVEFLRQGGLGGGAHP